jgi:urocanate hydratase
MRWIYELTLLKLKEMNSEEFKKSILVGIPDEIPPILEYDTTVNHAPRRKDILTTDEKKLAVKNALRYFRKDHHPVLAPEFLDELYRYGRIYMYRYKPRYRITARNIDAYPHRSRHAAAIMVMLSNNLDDDVAQHPHELITYGGNGAVFQNWAQYLLTMKYLATMTDEQTLVLYSGHPMGLFPSHSEAPRVVVTNGMVIPNYSSPDDYERFNALGVTQYGQMTAGSFMYIGPQGIVHGTTITVINAARKIKKNAEDGLAGKVFVTSGLGGMSGAQPKATVIAGGICLVAEVNPKAIMKRKSQGWIDEVYDNLDKIISRISRARKNKEAVSVAYSGNVVSLWEKLVKEDIDVELGSDQTSLHNPFAGGYYPVGLNFEEANKMMVEYPDKFRITVRESLKRQVTAINIMAGRGMYFWDYGNAFLLESGRAGADIFNPGGGYRYPSYVEDIMGPLFFDYGFGPFRWICTSNDPGDLELTDRIALEVLEELYKKAPEQIQTQLADNIRWIREAKKNQLVVGSQARILYADCEGRTGP